MTIHETSFEVAGSDGLPVRCDLRRPEGEGPFPVAVILHGFKGFKEWGMFPPTAERFAEAGLAAVSVDSSHNGVGPGGQDFDELELFAKNTAGREVEDLTAVLDAISNGLDPTLDTNRIGLLGHSRGGGVVLLVAAGDARVKSVVTWAAVSRLNRWTDRARDEWLERGRIDIPNARTGQVMWMDRVVLEDLESRAEEYDVLAAARRLRMPVLTIHGEVDEAVPLAEGTAISGAIDSVEKQLLVIPATGHTFAAVHPWAGPTPAWEQVVSASADWFVRTLAG